MRSDNEIVLPSNRKFGLFFSAVFASAGVVAISYNSLLLATLNMILALGLVPVALYKPNILLVLNKAWMKLGLLLAKIVNPIVLGIIYFGLFTPLGLLFKLTGRDELALRFTKKQSYWKMRETIEPASLDYTKQY